MKQGCGRSRRRCGPVVAGVDTYDPIEAYSRKPFT
jgi:hypothetical protein